MPTYVEYGVADCGIAGRDVLLETKARRLRAARPRASAAAGSWWPAWPAPPPPSSAVRRVATKYARVATAHFLERGLSAEVVKLAGSVELAPGLGLADCIVDVVETGRTLDENGLEIVEEVATSSARLVVNRASYHARREEVASLVARLAAAAAPAAEPAAREVAR